MPSMPASIIRFTALPPPPPTPITFMRAPVIGGSSSIKIFMLLPGSRTSGVMSFSSLPNLPNREGVHGHFGLAEPRAPISCEQHIVPLARQHTTLGQKILLLKRLRNL